MGTWWGPLRGLLAVWFQGVPVPVGPWRCAMTQVAVRRLAGGRARLTGVVLALAAATALPACAGGGPSEGQSVDPWAVARELDRAAASASASAQA